MPERKQLSVEEVAGKITTAERWVTKPLNKRHDKLADSLAELGTYSRILLSSMKAWAEKTQTPELETRMHEAASNIVKRREIIFRNVKAEKYSAIRTDIETSVKYIIGLVNRARESINEQLARINEEVKSAPARVQPVLADNKRVPYPHSQTRAPQSVVLEEPYFKGFSDEEVAELASFIPLSPDELSSRNPEEATQVNQRLGNAATDRHQEVQEETQPSANMTGRGIRRQSRNPKIRVSLVKNDQTLTETRRK